MEYGEIRAVDPMMMRLLSAGFRRMALTGEGTASFYRDGGPDRGMQYIWGRATSRRGRPGARYTFVYCDTARRVTIKCGRKGNILNGGSLYALEIYNQIFA